MIAADVLTVVHCLASHEDPSWWTAAGGVSTPSSAGRAASTTTSIS